MFQNNRVEKKAFEDMKSALTEAVMLDVGQKLLEEGKKQQKQINEKLIDRMEEFTRNLKGLVDQAVEDGLNAKKGQEINN